MQKTPTAPELQTSIRRSKADLTIDAPTRFKTKELVKIKRQEQKDDCHGPGEPTVERRNDPMLPVTVRHHNRSFDSKATPNYLI